MAGTGRDAYVVHHRDHWGDAAEVSLRTSDHTIEQARIDLVRLKALSEGTYVTAGNEVGADQIGYFPSLFSRPDSSDGYKTREEAAELVKDESALLELMLNPPPKEAVTELRLNVDTVLAIGALFRKTVELVEARANGSAQKQDWERIADREHLSGILQRNPEWPTNPEAKRAEQEGSLKCLGVTDETMPLSITVPAALAKALGLQPTE